MRSLDSGIVDNSIVRNPFVWGALVICALLLLGTVYVPFLADLLRIQPLNATEWLVVLFGSLAPLVLGQIALAIAGRGRAPRRTAAAT